MDTYVTATMQIFAKNKKKEHPDEAGGGKGANSTREPSRTKVCKLTWAWGIAIFSSSFSLSGFCADTGFKEIFTMFASWGLGLVVCCLVRWAAFLHRPGQFYSGDAVSPPGLSDVRGASSLTNKPCVGLKEKPPRYCQNKSHRRRKQQSLNPEKTNGVFFSEKWTTQSPLNQLISKHERFSSVCWKNL